MAARRRAARRMGLRRADRPRLWRRPRACDAPPSGRRPGRGRPGRGNNLGPAAFAGGGLGGNVFPPFRGVGRRTSVGAVMPSYNEIDGVPSHANTWLLGDVLRGEWGVDGLIVSDYGGVHELATLHHLAADEAEAARLALEAGVDSELPEGQAFATLADRSEEHTSGLQSLMRISYAVFCLKKKKTENTTTNYEALV